MTGRNIFIAVWVWLVAVCGLPAVAQKAGVAASVNEQPITEEKFRQTLLEWYGREILEEMIEAEVIAQAARRKGVSVTDQEVDARLQAIRERMDRDAARGNGPAFEQWLEASGMTVPHYRAQVRTMMLLEALVKDEVTVSPEEVARFYERNIKRFWRPALVNISVITVNTEQEAEIVYDLLTKRGESWASVAERYNTDPRTMKTGGEWGFCPNDNSPIMLAAFALERDGDISRPLAASGKWHVIKRLDRQSERTLPFEEVKAAIEADIRSRKTKQLMEETRVALMSAAHIQRFMQFPAREPASPRPGG